MPRRCSRLGVRWIAAVRGHGRNRRGQCGLRRRDGRAVAADRLALLVDRLLRDEPLSEQTFVARQGQCVEPKLFLCLRQTRAGLVGQPDTLADRLRARIPLLDGVGVGFRRATLLRVKIRR